MRTLLFFTVYFGLLSVVACTSVGDLPQESGEYLAFGSFGGFAGSYTEYILYSDGKMSKKDRLKGTPRILSGVEKKVAAQCIKIAHQLKSETSIHEAGNLSFFIRLYAKNGEEYEFLWGGVNEKVPEKLRILYLNLMALSKDQNPIM